MRFIDLDELEPLIRDLIPGLEEARDAVYAENDPEKRADLIDKYRQRWVALRPAMETLSHGKCWYVECTNPGTDDDVDHYRPKGRIAEDRKHPGYYWLAFDWQNLRLSCHRANRPRINPEEGSTGGKADHFPLIDPLARAYTPDDNIVQENPCIFDPTDPSDPPLLSFKPNGEVDLSPLVKGDSVIEERFRQTRLCLNLNWPTFRDARTELYNEIARLVRRGTKLEPPSPSSRLSEAFLNNVKDLVRIMSPRRQYSAAARIYVESFSDIWWVRDIVLRVVR